MRVRGVFVPTMLAHGGPRTAGMDECVTLTRPGIVNVTRTGYHR
ncbi:hypothetical protein SCOCK_350019 [Actinacidiphila cocklensis]|uniref:Uncharacterized protein n=1 Tax=Actinacidiphila cocklensis TaxID=887465 RepID=A0A9W4DT26_9ACTN|nr:hypothetical protein SCOCK_350019 [Actinacidiphila cocklensis]